MFNTYSATHWCWIWGLHCMRGQFLHHGACHVKLNKKNNALIICGFKRFKNVPIVTLDHFQFKKWLHTKNIWKRQRSALSPKNTILLETAPPKKEKKSPWHTTFDPNGTGFIPPGAFGPNKLSVKINSLSFVLLFNAWPPKFMAPVVGVLFPGVAAQQKKPSWLQQTCLRLEGV